MVKMTKRICTVDTVYSLFLYFLINGVSDDDLFIFSSGVPEDIRKNINHVYFPSSRFKFCADDNLIKFAVMNLGVCFRQLYGILKLRLLMLFVGDDVEIYGHGHTQFSYMFYEYENAYLIEDGLANYRKLESNFISNRLLNFLGLYIKGSKSGYGTHENIKKVYLTYKGFCDVSSKAEIIDLNALWENLSLEDHLKILKIFNFSNLENIDVLLITQAFSEDNLMDLNEEMRIYSEIVEKYPNIIIKPHPREVKDYSKIFPDNTVLDKHFPVELLVLMGIKIEKTVTISSTAVLHFPASEIETYWGDINSGYVKKSREALECLIKGLKD